MINDNDEFINAYRAYLNDLQFTRDSALQNVENTRRNAKRSIMSAANNLGTMYSNFPERDKIKYDTSYYMPAVEKVQNTYQTGLDKLRENLVNTYNTIAKTNADTRALLGINDEDKNTGWGLAQVNDDNTGTNFFGEEKEDGTRDPVRWYTWAYNNGWFENTSMADIYRKLMSAGKDSSSGDNYAGFKLSEDDINALKSIYSKTNGFQGMQKNVGKNHKDYTVDDYATYQFTQYEVDLLNRLGIHF